MNKVLILYPKEFKCYSKFSRKVSNIIQHLEDIEFHFQNDPNEFIYKFSKYNKLESKLVESKDWEGKEITHAIIFDDGEEFGDETHFLKSNNIPLRLIRIKITRVVNINRETKYQSIKSTPHIRVYW